MNFTLLQTVRKVSCHLSFVLAVAFGAGASLGVSPAQAERRDGKDDTAYTIKRVYKTGDADRYRIGLKMKMESPIGPVDMVETMLMKETTKEAKSDGSSITVYDILTASLTANGMDLDLAASLPKIITTRDKNGKADVKTEGGDEQLVAHMGEQIKQYVNFGEGFIPTTPVKVGDSWDVNVTDVGAKDQTVKGKTTLVSVDTVKGMKVAKLKSVMDVSNLTGTKVHSETTTFLDIATGKAMNVTSKSDGEAGGGKLSSELTMRLLSPDEKDDAAAPVKTESSAKKP